MYNELNIHLKGSDKMLFDRQESYDDLENIEVKKLVFLAKKLLPDVVFNMGNLEGNPFTFPEVQTLLEGITIGGHKLSDQEQILDLKNSWNLLFSLIMSNKFELNLSTFNKINFDVTKNEALIAGEFRDGEVRINGTDYIPPKSNDLKYIFENELQIIKDRCKSTIDLAFDIFLWGALNQFYYDGNKRTGRLMANGLLLSTGQGFLNIKAKHKVEFNTLTVDFYNTKNADNMFKFLYTNCFERF